MNALRAAGTVGQAENVIQITVLGGTTSSAGPAAYSISMQSMAMMASANMGYVYSSLTDSMIGPSPNILQNLDSSGGGMFLGPGTAGQFVPGSGYALAVKMAAGATAGAVGQIAGVMQSAKGKEGKLKGGKQGKREKWWDSYPEDFKNWFHRNFDHIGTDASKEEIKDYFKTWNQSGRPRS